MIEAYAILAQAQRIRKVTGAKVQVAPSKRSRKANYGLRNAKRKPVTLAKA